MGTPKTAGSLPENSFYKAFRPVLEELIGRVKFVMKAVGVKKNIHHGDHRERRGEEQKNKGK
jgi:hypothetical protein